MNFIISIGGTGARVTESFVYLAAAGIVPAGDYQICIVDKDIKCGNTERLRQTVADYKNMKDATGLSCMTASFENSAWDVETNMAQLCNQYNPATSKYKDVANSPADKELMNLFHTQAEQNFSLQDGFYGHPSLGAAIIEEIFLTPAFLGNQLFAAIQAEYRRTASPVNVTFAASVFGGTGASIFPNLARKLHELFPGQVNINGVMMLPYFTFSNAHDTANQEVCWTEFKQKAAVALEHYAKQADFVNPGVDGNYVFNSLYLVGADEMQNSCPQYTPGGEDQTHSFLAPDLIGGLAIARCFEAPALAADGNSKIYSYSVGASDGAVYTSLDKTKLPASTADQLAVFAKTAFSIRAYLYPQLYTDDIQKTNMLTKPFGSTGHFKNKVANVQVSDLRTYVQGTVPFCNRFLSYLCDLHRYPELQLLLRNPNGGSVLKELLDKISEYDEGNIGANAQTIINTVSSVSYVEETKPWPTYQTAWVDTRLEEGTTSKLGFGRIVESFYNTSNNE